MGIFALVEDSLSQIAKQLTPMAEDNKYVENVTSIFDSSSRAVKPEDSHRHAHAYKSLAYVLSNKVAQAVAKVPFDLYVAKNSSRSLANKTIPVSRERLQYMKMNHNHTIAKAVEVEQVVDSPILDLFNNVNPFYNRFDFIEMLSISMDMMGNTFWYVVKNAMGTPVELWTIPAQYMWVVADKKRFIKGYVMQKPAAAGNGTLQQVPFDQDEIIHFKYPSVNSLYYGVSPLGAMSEAYNLQLNIDRYDVSFFTNMTRPDGVLKTDGTVGADVFEKIRRQFKQRNSGVLKALTPLILEGGLEWQQTSLSPSEIGLKDARRDVLEKMAMAWGVPLAKLITENVNKANAEAAQIDFLRDAIQPRLTRIEQKINEQLMPMFGDSLFIAFQNPLPEDREFRLKERTQNIGAGYSTVNEERAKDGIEEIAGGDELKQQVLGGQSKGEPLAGNISQAPHLAAPLLKAHKSRTKEDRDLYYKAFKEKTEPLEDGFKKQLTKYFQKQERQVKANLRKIKGLHSQNRTRRALIKIDTADVENIVFSSDKWIEEYTAMMEEEYQSILLAAGLNAQDQIPGLAFDVHNPLAEKYIGERLPLIADEVGDTTLKKLRKSLRKGIHAGESIPDLAQRIELIYEEAVGYRAVMIARTETISAYSEGSLEGYIQSGSVAQVEWISTRDNDVRDDHLALDGIMSDLINNSTSWTFPDGVETRGPGLSGVAHQDINCRCAVAPVIDVDAIEAL